VHVFNYCVCIVYSLAVFHQSIIERENKRSDAKLPDGSYDDVTVVDVARIDEKGSCVKFVSTLNGKQIS
jgi:hypothetical protein